MKKHIFILTIVIVFWGNGALAQKGDWGLVTATSRGNLKSALNVKSVDDPENQFGVYIISRAGYIVGGLLSFVAVIFMILVIYGGILWMTARGNEQQVSRAQNILIQSIIGLILVFSAYVLVEFVGGVIEMRIDNVPG